MATSAIIILSLMAGSLFTTCILLMLPEVDTKDYVKLNSNL